MLFKPTKQLSAAKYSRRPLHVTLLLIDLCFLAAHIFFLVYFKSKGIEEMFRLNILSVLIYAVMGAAAYKKPTHITLYACITMIEVLIHAGAALVCVGWETGFAMFIVCCAPFPFFLEFKKTYVAYLFAAAIATEFIVIRIITYEYHNTVYNTISEQEASRLFLFNSCISFMIITIFSVVYKRAKQLDQLNMKAKNESLTMLAKIDPLSQLFNRRAMIDFLKKIEQDAKEGRGAYVLAMGDLDSFKHINDTYGHSAGDNVITTVSRMMTEEVPSEGYVCRWGGEELLFAVPYADVEKGTAIAERIRERLSQHSFVAGDGREYHVTVTFGVCGCDGSFSYERAVSIADKRLYYGKQHGKNRVVSEPVENENPENTETE